MVYNPGNALLPNVDQVVIRDAADQAPVPAAQRIEYSVEEIVYVSLLASVIVVSIGLILRSLLSHVLFAMRLRSCRLLDDRAADRFAST